MTFHSAKPIGIFFLLLFLVHVEHAFRLNAPSDVLNTADILETQAAEADNAVVEAQVVKRDNEAAAEDNAELAAFKWKFEAMMSMRWWMLPLLRRIDVIRALEGADANRKVKILYKPTDSTETKSGAQSVAHAIAWINHKAGIALNDRVQRRLDDRLEGVFKETDRGTVTRLQADTVQITWDNQMAYNVSKSTFFDEFKIIDKEWKFVSSSRTLQKLDADGHSYSTVYRLRKGIGEGGFGKVYKAKKIEAFGNTKEVAVKVSKGMEAVVEFKFLKKLKDKLYVPDVDDLIRIGSSFFLVQQLIEADNLLQYLKTTTKNLTKQLPDGIVRTIFRKIVEAVDDCHKSGVAHRDLKLENMMIEMTKKDGVRVWIIDFGLAADMSDQLTEKCGTFEYRAPETFSDDPYDGRKVDIWSCGIMLYTLLKNRLPFKSETSIKHSPIHLSPPRTKDAQDLASRMLLKDPTQRISMDSILSHPFLQLDPSVK